MHNPSLAIVWENALELPVFDLPEGATVFAKERWTGAAMMAGARRGSGAVLWVAGPPGERGYERFPYLLQALCDLGVETPFRARQVMGLLRFRLPRTCGSGLLCQALAEESPHCT